MAVTENLYTGDGSTVLFSFSFPYLNRSEVKVTVDGDATTAFTFATASQLQFTTAPASGKSIRIYRDTNVDTAKATFVQGSAIRATDLNNNFTQIRYATQESRNNIWKKLDTDTQYADTAWTSDDTKIPTVEAVENRIQDLIADSNFIPVDAAEIGYTPSGTGAVARNVQTKLREFVNVRDFGAIGDGTTDDTAAINAAITAAMVNKKSLYFGGGTFLVGTLNHTLTADLYIELDGATIKGAAASTCILTFAGANTYGFAMNGPGVIDGSLRDYNPGVASGSGIDVQRTTFCRFNGIYFKAGTQEDAFGDSGINISYGRDTTITNCQFFGWNDHDIYITGSGWNVSTDPENSLTITGCTFRDNSSGSIRIAREFRYVTITGNTFDNVHKAVVAAGGNTNWNPGNSIVFSGNVVKSCRDVALDFRYFTNGLVITNNLIHDWGTSGSGGVINLRGVSNSVITGNVMKPSSAAATTGCEFGIYLQSATNPSLTLGQDGDPTYVWPSSNNLIAYNVIEIVDRGDPPTTGNACIWDQSGSTTNVFQFNRLTDGYSEFIYTQTSGVERTKDNQVIHQNATGLGFGTKNPRTDYEFMGDVILEGVTSFYRQGITGQYTTIESNAGSHSINGYSSTTNAKKFIFNCTTDLSNTSPSSGALGYNFRILNSDKFVIEDPEIISEYPIRLPRYVTGNLPTTGISEGAIAYDTTTNTVKFYNGSVWANI